MDEPEEITQEYLDEAAADKQRFLREDLAQIPDYPSSFELNPKTPLPPPDQG